MSLTRSCVQNAARLKASTEEACLAESRTKCLRLRAFVQCSGCELNELRCMDDAADRRHLLGYPPFRLAFRAHIARAVSCRPRVLGYPAGVQVNWTARRARPDHLLQFQAHL